MINKTRPLITFLAGVILLSGCAGGPVRMTKDVSLDSVRRIAVLPFDNLSDEVNAGEKVTNVFVAALHKEQVVQILALGEVERFLIRNRIRNTSQIDLGLLSAMGRELGVDAVLLGIVDEYGYRVMSGEQIPVVGISIRVLDTRTGRILLAASCSKSGMDSETVFTLGRIRSVSQLTEKITDATVRSFAARFPGKLAPGEETAWLTPRQPSDEPAASAREPVYASPAPEEAPGESRTLEDVERERAMQNGKNRTEEWYEEIKRRREQEAK